MSNSKSIEDKIINCMREQLKKETEEVYNRCEGYLDEHFSIEFSKNDNYFQRLWELWVCHGILSSSYEKQLLNTNKKHKKQSAPDFILKNSIDDKDVLIECVCPSYSSDQAYGPSSFEYNANENGQVTISSGFDEVIVSRYTSNLKDKSEKAKKYITNYTDAFLILCVSGSTLKCLKGWRHNAKDPLCTDDEFEKAWRGEIKVFFNRGDDGLKVENHSLAIRKNNEGIIYAGHQEYLGMFDCIVFRDHFPFIYSSKYFEVIYKSDEKEQQLKPLVEEIFSPKKFII